MNGEPLGKFSFAEDGHKLKYVQKSSGVTFSFWLTCIEKLRQRNNTGWV